jgi:hypothetical protein
MKLKALAPLGVAAGIAMTMVATAAPAMAYVADYETYTVASSVSLRSCAHTSCTRYALINPQGAAVDLKCWVHGDLVNGRDNIWYRGYWMGSGYPEGYMPGEYLATGYDPNPSVAPC